MNIAIVDAIADCAGNFTLNLAFVNLMLRAIMLVVLKDGNFY